MDTAIATFGIEYIIQKYVDLFLYLFILPIHSVGPMRAHVWEVTSQLVVFLVESTI